MASAAAFTGVLDELECTICTELFTDPVTLDCGHNFCQVCITKYCEEWKELGDLNCPLCVHRIKNKNFQRNWILANMVGKIQLAKQHMCVQHMKKFSLFCQEDSALVCEICEGSSEHKSHSVLPLEKAAEEYKVGNYLEISDNRTLFCVQDQFVEKKTHILSSERLSFCP